MFFSCISKILYLLLFENFIYYLLPFLKNNLAFASCWLVAITIYILFYIGSYRRGAVTLYHLLMTIHDSITRTYDMTGQVKQRKSVEEDDGYSRWLAQAKGTGGGWKGGSKLRRLGGRVGPVVSTLRLPPCCSAVASSRRPLLFDPPNNQYILT